MEKLSYFYILQVKLHSKEYKDFNLKEVIGKIKKLRQKYKSVKDQKNKSGNSANPKRELKFFQEIDKFVRTKHNINPPSLIDTSVDSVETKNKQVGDNSSKYISSSRKDPCPHHIGNFCPPGRGEEKCLKMSKKGREILMLVCSRGYTQGGGKGIFNFLHVGGGGGVWIFSGMNHYFFISTIFIIFINIFEKFFYFS